HGSLAGGPASGAFTLVTTPAGTGNINLSAGSGPLNIDTSTSFAGASGGNFSAFATGSILLGSVTTSSTNPQPGSSGSVTIMGNGVTAGAITGTGGTNGAVSITSANATAGNSVIINNGSLFGGFSAGTLGGNIALNGAINTGTGSITVKTGGTGTVTNS